jgi:ABC-type sugar transport system substrate-binding protein
MFVPFTRIIAMAMAGVLCFALLVPMAVSRHNTALAIFVSVVFFVYLGANVVLWQRMRRRV